MYYKSSSKKEVYSDKYAEGVIIKQSPEGGSKLEASNEYIISVKVSKGKQMRKLPVVKAKTIDTVAKELASLGFLVNAEYQYSDTVSSQIVMSYKDYEAGDALEDGSTVVIIVSKGVKVTEPPVNIPPMTEN